VTIFEWNHHQRAAIDCRKPPTPISVFSFPCSVPSSRSGTQAPAPSPTSSFHYKMAAPYVYPYIHIYTRMQRWVCNRTHQHFVVLSTLTLYSLLYPGFSALRRECFSIFQNHQVCGSAMCATSEFRIPSPGVGGGNVEK
jgi:hypothetical protein